MATFTSLGAADFAAIATAFDIGPVTASETIAAGTINSNFSLVTDVGRYFARVNEGKSELAVRYEAELVAALAQAGVATPVPLRASSGERYFDLGGKLVSVFPWVEGGHRRAGSITARDTRQVGETLAGMHVVGLAVADRFESESIYTTERITERYEGFRASSDPALAEAIPIMGAELAYLADHAAERGAAVHGIIHGDLFADNVLFDGDRLAAFIDFEQASSGSLVYDLAVCLNAWCYTDAFDRELITSMIAGYGHVRSLDRAEANALAIEVRAAAVRFAVTRVTDIYLPGLDAPGKDFRRYLDRLACWQAEGPALLAAGVGAPTTAGVGSGE
jgi:homoserine kinase type II